MCVDDLSVRWSSATGTGPVVYRSCGAGPVQLGLARTIYIRCIYGIFGREITEYTVIYGVYIRFWPTLSAMDTEFYFACIVRCIGLCHYYQALSLLPRRNTTTQRNRRKGRKLNTKIKKKGEGGGEVS